MNIDWSNAPEGFPIWIEDLNPDAGCDVSGWASEHGGRFRDMDGAYWKPSGEGVIFKVHRKPEPWAGEGLPPVGTVCEMRRIAWGDAWGKVKVLCFGVKRAFFQNADGTEQSLELDKIEFRPIRTPEQIAADKRLHEIRNALSAINSKVHFPNDLVRGNILAAAVEAMIDAGYRKQVTP